MPSIASRRQHNRERHGETLFEEDDARVEGTSLAVDLKGEGIISVATKARNQHGVEVLAYRRTLLVYRRGTTAPYANAGY